MSRSSKSDSLARLEWIGNFLDSSIPLGKSGYRIGVDPLIGLIPVIGDPLSALAGCYIIIEAARLGASRFILGRMMINLGFDALVGAVPILGDFFDFTFKANQRNVQLVKDMKAVIDHHPERRLSAAFFITLLMLIVFIAMIFTTVLFTTIKLVGLFFNL